MPDTLHATFSALADPTRRAILARLAQGPANVTELALPFAMSQPAISSHLRVLERAGLVARSRDAQSRPCHLVAAPIKEVLDWAAPYRAFWEQGFDRLDHYLATIQPKEKTRERKKRNPAPAALELTLTRTFEAPRQLVYDAWTKPEHLAHWSGPEGYTTPHSEMDMREGGRYRACLRAPDGSDHWVQGVYLELSPPARLVMTHAWENAEGGTTPVTTITVTFDAVDERRTLMTFRQTGFDSAEERDGHSGGWSSSFVKLQSHLADAVKD